MDLVECYWMQLVMQLYDVIIWPQYYNQKLNS